MQNKYTSISILLVLATSVQCGDHMAPQPIHQKLENALKTNTKLLYLMQGAFFSFYGFSQDFVFLDVCITVGTGRCTKNSSFSGVLSNSSYHQKFQWSSSALLDLISNDQLLIMDNVLCRAVQNGIRHCSWFPMTLQIDSLPVGVSEKDLLEALIQLLYWVCVFRSNIIQCTVRDDLGCLYKFVLRHSMQILFIKVFSTLDILVQ